VARDADELTALSAIAGGLAETQVEHRVLDHAETLALEPSLSSGVQGALLIPEHGFVAVTPFMNALVDACRQRGVLFHTAYASEVAVHTRPFVSTDRGRYESDVVVVAAGSWSSQLSRVTMTDPRVRPIKGQMLRLHARGRAASRILWGSRCYIVPWPDGTTLVGATVEDVGFDERPTAGAMRQLIDAAVDLVPSLAESTVEEMRVGLRPLSVDELPVIGRSSSLPGVIYATGHYRNGVLLAPLTASLVADLVLDGRHRSELALTDPARLGL
jgi:glycine oxidase